MTMSIRAQKVLVPLLAVLAFASADASAQQRTVLHKISYPENHDIYSIIAEVEPGKCTGRHTHPGAESAYVLEGQGVVKIDGKPDVGRGVGQPIVFMPGEIHEVCNVGDVRFKALAHYIVQTGQPLAKYEQPR